MKFCHSPFVYLYPQHAQSLFFLTIYLPGRNKIGKDLQIGKDKEFEAQHRYAISNCNPFLPNVFLMFLRRSKGSIRKKRLNFGKNSDFFDKEKYNKMLKRI